MGNSALKRHFETAEKTGVLNISGAKLKEFPPRLLSLQSVLRTLDLSDNRFNSIPAEIGLFLQLKFLSLNKNKLDHLPTEICQLIKLEVLNVSSNKLVSLPDSLSKLTNLKEVNFSENELSSFPTMLCKLKHLDVIDLSKNKITNIPSEIATLHVTELNLNQNQISSISPEIAKCPKLKTLRMEENCLQLSSIPISLLRESKVTMINVEGNLFEMKQFTDLDGYDKYMERYTEVKKKLF
uniref:Disease resistance R13L4/SHOC-2-like LRR domain-containing protein n=2 Tax=Clastoptera arizonana TaxID=38151 RepID=A0A1B6EB31_9HEMI